MNRLKIFYKFTRLEIVSNLIYLKSIYIQLISNILFLVIQYFLWEAIYASNDIEVLNFRYIFVYMILVQMLSNIYPNIIGNKIMLDVKNGDIVFKLLKPFSYTKQVIFEEIGDTLFKIIVLNIPIYLLLFLFNDQLNLSNFLYFLVMFILSYLFYSFFEMIFGIFSFYTNSTWGLKNFKYAIIMILSGKIIPLEFYPKYLLKIIDVLPFKYLYSEPIKAILIGGERRFDIIMIQLINLIAIILIYKYLFYKVIKKLKIQGG